MRGRFAVSVFLFGLLFGVGGLLFSDPTDSTRALTNAIVWCCLGLVVGLMVEMVSSSKEQYLVNEVKHSDLCKKLVDADKAEIMATIRAEAQKATPNYRPEIYLETGLNNLRVRTSSWEYKYLTKDEKYALMLAIGDTDGYLVEGERGYQYIVLDDEYWWPIIEYEIDRVQQEKADELKKEKTENT